jgi:hypothetical protein
MKRNGKIDGFQVVVLMVEGFKGGPKPRVRKFGSPTYQNDFVNSDHETGANGNFGHTGSG